MESITITIDNVDDVLKEINKIIHKQSNRAKRRYKLEYTGVKVDGCYVLCNKVLYFNRVIYFLVSDVRTGYIEIAQESTRNVTVYIPSSEDELLEDVEFKTAIK